MMNALSCPCCELTQREMAANPSGTQFHIEVFEPPEKPRKTWQLAIDDGHDYITRTYSLLGRPTNIKQFPVRLSGLTIACVIILLQHIAAFILYKRKKES